ncbi:Phenylalanine-tRNA ligase, mitochondrial [Zancudomyces culisetae]|uniref:phenylalanine--tRNA ligase n=1 Tax=Zancudomyces culisetae TaxID=1213189 RepID=A0A1R1PU83_ZANCU|nr:Phenylalanine-tRNA ligase, mitochondrial [Zancudomyces culisetae]|eukprot:OMH84545.1 Phenylalanine-tRNA ligase, mitochondrial [Zancudomyces culisetae]
MQDKPSLTIETHNEGYDAIKNPIQKCHDPKQVELIINDMKSAMNNMVASILSQAANTVGQEEQLSKLQVRWIEAYFPFTSPSWEMEVFWGGEWLELCGCGVMRQELLQNAKLDDRIGWAFGFGLERLAMVLFGIPDIRLFWSSDPRFLGQFEPRKISRFVPFSKHPACHKDISFWIGKAGNTNVTFHENDMNDLIREIAGDLVQDVVLVDEFTSKKINRTSKCYRINYCSMDRNVTNEEINAIQERVRKEMSERLDIELR